MAVYIDAINAPACRRALATLRGRMPTAGMEPKTIVIDASPASTSMQ